MQNTTQPQIISLLRERLPEVPIIVLSKPMDPESKVLDIQNYVIAGETIIPLFSSNEALKASTRGTDLNRPLIQISRALLAEIAKEHHVFLLDPHLERQLRFSADDLRRAFPEPLSPPREPD